MSLVIVSYNFQDNKIRHLAKAGHGLFSQNNFYQTLFKWSIFSNFVEANYLRTSVVAKVVMM